MKRIIKHNEENISQECNPPPKKQKNKKHPLNYGT